MKPIPLLIPFIYCGSLLHVTPRGICIALPVRLLMPGQFTCHFSLS